jgi:hypothetical protein
MPIPNELKYPSEELKRWILDLGTIGQSGKNPKCEARNPKTVTQHSAQIVKFRISIFEIRNNFDDGTIEKWK